MNELIVTIGDEKKSISILTENKVEMNGKVHDVNLSKLSEHLYLIKIDEKVYEVTATKNTSEQFSFSVDGRFIETTVRTTLQEKANEVLKQRESLAKHDTVKAPMPGLLLKIKKKEGEHIMETY